MGRAALALLLHLPGALPQRACAAPGGCEPAGAARHHHWPTLGGDFNHTGASPHVAPDTARPAWTFQEGVDIVKVPPLIDGHSHIYLPTLAGHIYKFSPSGAIVWHYVHDAGIFGGLALMDGLLLGADARGVVFALDADTGAEAWRAAAGTWATYDVTRLLAVNGTVVTAVPNPNDDPSTTYQNRLVVALDAKNGRLKWRFTPPDEQELFNFMPAAPGDGTVVFMDDAGTVYRVLLENGDLLWESSFAGHAPGDDMAFTGAQAIIGPNDMVYAVHNSYPSSGSVVGVVRAVRLSDGEPVWHHTSNLVAMTSAAVGRIAGWDTLALVVGLGSPPGFPYNWMPDWFSFIVRAVMEPMFFGRKMIQWPGWLRFQHPSAVIALDALTGAQLWQWEPRPRTQKAGAGEDRHVRARREAQKTNGDLMLSCYPTAWTAPTIGGDGAVYAGAMDGRFYTFRDADGNGIIDGSSREITTFDAGDAFSGNAAHAPGLLAVASCSGGLYVFKT